MHAVEARSKKHIITIKTNMLTNMKTPFCAVGVTQTSPNPMFWKESFVKMSTALKREHHFVKKDPSSEADLRSRLLKWVHRCNGASTRAPKSTKKLKKLLWIYRLCWNFKNERFEWECSKKCPQGTSQGRPKASDLAESVRKNIIRQTSTQQKKLRMYNAGY